MLHAGRLSLSDVQHYADVYCAIRFKASNTELRPLYDAAMAAMQVAAAATSSGTEGAESASSSAPEQYMGQEQFVDLYREQVGQGSMFFGSSPESLAGW